MAPPLESKVDFELCKDIGKKVKPLLLNCLAQLKKYTEKTWIFYIIVWTSMISYISLSQGKKIGSKNAVFKIILVLTPHHKAQNLLYLVYNII